MIYIVTKTETIAHTWEIEADSEEEAKVAGLHADHDDAHEESIDYDITARESGR